MKKYLALILAVLMMATMLVGTASAEEPKVIRLAASDPASYPLCMADTYFGERLAEISGGALVVETFFDGLLGEEADTVEGLSLGMLEMARVSAGNMATFIPELELFNLPFLFTGAEHFKAVITGDVLGMYEELFDAAGYKLITLYEEGTRYIFNKTKSIVTPADLAGVKIRTMGAQSIQDGFKAMGASPVPMSSGEVYTSLSSGILDACENNYSTIWSNRLFENAKYFSNTEHLRVPSVLLCSKDYWEAFTAEEQAWIAEAAADAFVYASETFDKGEEEAFAALIDAGCIYTEITAEQRAEFAALCTDVYAKYAINETAQQILDAIAALA